MHNKDGTLAKDVILEVYGYLSVMTDESGFSCSTKYLRVFFYKLEPR